MTLQIRLHSIFSFATLIRSISCYRIGFAFLTILMATCVFAEDTVWLKHDDGTQESKRSMSGGGHTIEFECPDAESWYLTEIAIYGSRYGASRPPREKFDIIIANQDASNSIKTKKPYSLFERGAETWVKFKVPTIEVPKTFRVSAFFNPTRAKGVYVGIDESARSNSFVATPGASGPGKPLSEGGWMIQAYVTKNKPAGAKSLLSRQEQLSIEEENEASDEKELLGDARSITLKHDTDDKSDVLNIQGALYTVEFETPRNVEAYVWQVQLNASQFGGSHDSEAVNGDVYILNEDRKIISRTSFPYSLATQDKRWFSIPTLPTRVKGRFFVSVDAHGTRTKGLYMSYQETGEPDNASTDEIDEDEVKPANWSSRFEGKRWLIRAKIADRPVVYKG